MLLFGRRDFFRWKRDSERAREKEREEERKGSVDVLERCCGREREGRHFFPLSEEIDSGNGGRLPPPLLPLCLIRGNPSSPRRKERK